MTSGKVQMATDEDWWRWRDSWPPGKPGMGIRASNPWCSTRKRAPSKLKHRQMRNTPRVSRDGGRMRDSLGQNQRQRPGLWYRHREGSNKQPWLERHGKQNVIAERSNKSLKSLFIHVYSRESCTQVFESYCFTSWGGGLQNETPTFTTWAK